MRDLTRLLSYLKRNQRLVVTAYSALVFTTGLNVAIPWIIKQSIDVGLGAQDESFLLLSGLAVIGITSLKGIFTFAQGYLTEALSQKAALDLREELYGHLQSLGFDFFDRARTGQLMTRVVSDVEVVRMFIGFALANLVSTVLLFAGIITILLSLNWRLALLSLGTLPALILITVRLANRIRPLFNRVQEQLGKTTTLLQENITGVRVVRAFAQEDQEIERFASASQDLLARHLETSRMWALNFPLMTFITGLGVAAILWYGGTEVVVGRMSIGTLVAFTSYLAMLAGPVRQLGWMVNLFARASASGQRIFEVLDSKPSIVDAAGARHLPCIKGYVRFENVSFSYDGEAETLVNIDFAAEPGTVVAIVGPVGSGKSTLASLIPRFYDVTGGRITVDGHDVRDIAVSSLRRQVGVVLQEPILFSGTVRDNITYGFPNASLEEVVAAAKMARIHDTIVGLDNGYDSHVGERGVNLSGGQKQRLCLARTLLTNPRILILDDSTSSVDSETERLIQEALDELVKDRTTFIITHRLSFTMRAHLILVLEDGRIVERGSHAELVRLGGRYARLCALQLPPSEWVADADERGVHNTDERGGTKEPGEGSSIPETHARGWE